MKAGERMRSSINKRKGISAAAVLVLMLLTAFIAGAGVYIWQNPQIQGKTFWFAKQAPAKSMRETIQYRADEILHALKDNDMKKLAAYVHPDKGLRFSPYASVNTEKDIVIKTSEVPNLLKDATKRIWGAYDGSGEPIDLTFDQYFKKFVYDVDFLEAPQIVFDEVIQRGNSINNIKDAYPNAKFIEYHFPGFEKKYEGMDWRSLRLVFEQKENIWYLIGIVHDQWTI
jgi:hypothetical protein